MGYIYPEYHAAWVAANQDRYKAAKRAWYERNKQRVIDANRERVKADPAKERDRLALYRQRNPEKCAERVAISKRKNAEAVSSYNLQWQRDNPEKIASYHSKWRGENSHKVNAANSKRRASKLSSTPSWADEFIISEIYDLAKRRSVATGVKHHADHIVPLQSKLVCGLHCEANLRVIPSKDNISKGNRFWPDMP